MKFAKIFCFITLVFTYNACLASSIIWHKQSATAWLPAQTISGELTGFSAAFVIIHHDDTVFTVPVNNNRISYISHLHNGVNSIWAEAKDKINTVYSDTLVLTMGYKLLPVIKPLASVKGNKVLLLALVIENPLGAPLTYLWKASRHNPAPVVIKHADDSAARLVLPGVAGDYFFSVTVTAGVDTATFATYVTRDSKGINPFDIDTSHADWINKAIVYEITPHHFVDSTKYADIAAKLPELKTLGINTIWLQPLNKTKRGGQGYDVTDYFSIRPEFGSEEDLQQLITTAKNLDMRVLFDFVPNHTSVDHPYAKDCLDRGTASPYYNFYQHTNDGAPYSSYYKSYGSFIGYFWKDLVNLNYENTEVQQWILEACKYWVRKYDIDGYRLDAVWAVNARAPLFGKRLQQELKSIKPGLLLLAEDKGSMSQTYEKGYDAAYDWTADTTWVSQWSWQYSYSEDSNKTIFNHPDVSRGSNLLRKALFDNGDKTHLRLRFLENNDLPRFIKSHGLQRTKMAAALLFALPGIPMIYNGQETGSINHPYRRGNLFKKDKTIQSLDSFNLFSYYQQLVAIRLQHKSFYGIQLQEVPAVNTEAVIALRRWSVDENIIVLINMSSSPAIAELDVSGFLRTPGEHLQFKDLLLKKSIYAEVTATGRIKVSIDGYTTRILLH